MSSSKEKQKEYYLANKPRIRERRRLNARKKMLAERGLTEETYKLLFEYQDSKCGICETETPGEYHGWCVDHDHERNIVRGILCHNCNVLLGHARDSKDILRKAMEYLS